MSYYGFRIVRKVVKSYYGFRIVRNHALTLIVIAIVISRNSLTVAISGIQICQGL